MFNYDQPSNDLLFILQETNIKHDGTFKDILARTQKIQPEGWLRDPKISRWEMPDYYKDKKETLNPAFFNIKYIQTLHPNVIHYDYALMHGGKFEEMLKRMHYLVQLWHEGIRFNTLVFLCGLQSLHPSELQACKQLLNVSNEELPSTESDLAQLIYKHIIAQEPELQIVPVIFTKTPEKILPDGRKVQPTTESTIKTWLQNYAAQPGTCIAFSTQPFVHYQHLVLQTILPENFTLETVGVEAEQTAPTGLILDAITRHLYQLKSLKRAK